MRISSYAIYPGNEPVLSKFVTFITTQLHSWFNQGATSTTTNIHTAGRPRLFMAWRLSTASNDKGDTTDPYPKGVAQIMPKTSYWTFHNPPGPDELLFQETHYVAVGNGRFTITTTNIDGLPGSFLGEYIHLTLFDDSFDAPLVDAEVM